MAQLSYRGIPYQSEALNHVLDLNQVSGKYRGAAMRIDLPEVAIPETVTILRYRGIPYLRAR